MPPWHGRFDSVLPWRRTLLVRLTKNGGAKSDRTARKRTPAILNYKGTERDSLPGRQCHRGTVVSTVYFPGVGPCSFDLPRTVVRGQAACAEAVLGDPELQGNGRRFTAGTAVPPWHCHFDNVLRWRRTLLVRLTKNRCAKRDRTAQKRTPAILNYKGTEQDSLPGRQCHRGTFVSTVFFAGVGPCSFDLQRTVVRRAIGLRRNGPRRS